MTSLMGDKHLKSICRECVLNPVCFKLCPEQEKHLQWLWTEAEVVFKKRTNANFIDYILRHYNYGNVNLIYLKNAGDFRWTTKLAKRR